MNYWLMKSEPDDFSIDDLQMSEQQTVAWQGIRNYQARNYIRDQIALGDVVLFYHSSCKVPAIVGLAKISSDAQIDISAFDNRSPYFDVKSNTNTPRWWQVDIQFMAKLSQPVSLKQLKADLALQNMVLVAKGARLSVQPVSQEQYQHIIKLTTPN
ncbi:EVE domain-containing protein [Shewanella livingstonensis]|uniref:EVE domain-containing protein n=1 Tax=Shewanella livingstonensis TaxID=150120 RepID=A0A3G8LV27_9GAMM|nr:EVE domain-containing protein [Shewanella livingstonensis]AZG72985.1 EVE domain-containing protein [Shewanella livingstonensis]